MLLGSKHWIAKHENKNDFQISRTIAKLQMEEEIKPDIV
jgi:hypothetical protein